MRRSTLSKRRVSEEKPRYRSGHFSRPRMCIYDKVITSFPVTLPRGRVVTVSSPYTMWAMTRSRGPSGRSQQWPSASESSTPLPGDSRLVARLAVACERDRGLLICTRISRIFFQITCCLSNIFFTGDLSFNFLKKYFQKCVYDYILCSGNFLL